MNNSSKEMIIDDLQREIMMIDYPLSFDKDYDVYMKHLFMYNCYAYAMGLQNNDNYKCLNNRSLSIYIPGTISYFEHGHIQNGDDLIRAFMNDCEALGLEYKETSIDGLPEEYSNKVAIYNRPFYVGKASLGGHDDFHFVRQNVDGRWSHKCGYIGGVFLVPSDKIGNLGGYYSKHHLLNVYSLKKKK